MRILFVLEHFHPYVGGVEFLFWQLSNELIKQGYKVKVITTWYDKSLAQKETINGIDVFRVNCKNRFSFAYKSIPAIYSNVDDFDIIHTTTYTAAPPTWLVAKLKNKKSVLTFHEYWGKLWRRLPFLNPLHRLLFSTFERMVAMLSFTKVIAVSNFTQQSLIEAGIKPSKIVRIYNGLDYESIQLLSDQISSQPRQKNENETLNFIFVGRLGVSKGLDLLLAAAHEFLPKHPDAILNLVIPTRPQGMYKRITSIIEKLPSANQVNVMHNLSKEALYKEMKNASFIVIPSYSEGFCFVAAEACALNIPIVSSQCGALAEVVNGQYVPMSSLSKQGLIHALEKAAKGEWQHKKNIQFTLSESVEQYIHLYKEMING